MKTPLLYLILTMTSFSLSAQTNLDSLWNIWQDKSQADTSRLQALHEYNLAALEMAAFVKNRKLEREAAGKIPFEMRAGINTGNVVAGIVGIKKFQYDIWGDTVNIASRMESNGEIGKVNISQNTFEKIKDNPIFKFESRGKIQVKGKGEVQMYFVEKN